MSLALVADWSRTYRSRAVTFAGTRDAQLSRNGIRIVPDRVTASRPSKQLLPPIESPNPATVLDQALRAIAARYGAHTADFVAMQLEGNATRLLIGKVR